MDITDLRTIAPDLKLTENGWWASPTLSAVSYPHDGNSLCFAVEDSSFWFQHRNRCILEVMKRFPPPGTLFDIGGGNGCVARAIQGSGYDVVLVEPGLTGVQNSVKRGITRVVRASLDDVVTRPETIPAVGLFDVVEHVQDDSAFLSKINRYLTPKGRVYITVPAYQWLWSKEDINGGHSRRYTLQTLTRLLSNTGYIIDFSTYLFGFLPLPVFLCRALPHRLGFAPKQGSQEKVRSDHDPTNGLVARVLDKLTRRELSRIAKHDSLRWGGSCLVVARKDPGGDLD